MSGSAFGLPRARRAQAPESVFRFNAASLGQEDLNQDLAGEPEATWQWEADEGFPEISAQLLRNDLYAPLCWGARHTQ